MMDLVFNQQIRKSKVSFYIISCHLLSLPDTWPVTFHLPRTVPTRPHGFSLFIFCPYVTSWWFVPLKFRVYLTSWPVQYRFIFRPYQTCGLCLCISFWPPGLPLFIFRPYLTLWPVRSHNYHLPTRPGCLLLFIFRPYLTYSFPSSVPKALIT